MGGKQILSLGESLAGAGEDAWRNHGDPSASILGAYSGFGYGDLHDTPQTITILPGVTIDAGSKGAGDLSGYHFIVNLSTQSPRYYSSGFKGKALVFPISDGSAPEGPIEEFAGAILGLLHAKRKVYVHCDGGHGRTGLFLALLIKKARGVSSVAAIKAVRAEYCKNAVETATQVLWLVALDVPEVGDLIK